MMILYIWYKSQYTSTVINQTREYILQTWGPLLRTLYLLVYHIVFILIIRENRLLCIITRPVCDSMKLQMNKIFKK